MLHFINWSSCIGIGDCSNNTLIAAFTIHLQLQKLNSRLGDGRRYSKCKEANLVLTNFWTRNLFILRFRDREYLSFFSERGSICVRTPWSNQSCWMRSTEWVTGQQRPTSTSKVVGGQPFWSFDEVGGPSAARRVLDGLSYWATPACWTRPLTNSWLRCA